MHGAAVFSAVLLAFKKARINCLLTNAQSIEVCSEKYARSNRLLIHAQSSKVCTEQSFTQVCSKLRSFNGATLFLCHALSIEVCTAADQQYTQSVMFGASKYAPKYAPSNRRLLSHARSTEVCTEQTYTRSCSEHRSMHGATVY